MPLQPHRRRTGEKLAHELPLESAAMARRLLALGLAALGIAALAAARRRASDGEPGRNGGSAERAERLRRDLEEARERLRADIARAHGD
jgi:hypothetical protein